MLLLVTSLLLKLVGKLVLRVIAGGTWKFFGARGTGTLTAGSLQGTNIPVNVVFDIEKSHYQIQFKELVVNKIQKI